MINNYCGEVYDHKCPTPNLDCKDCSEFKSKHPDVLKESNKTLTRTSKRQRKWGTFTARQGLKLAFEDAKGELSCLKDEMETWNDNLQDNEGLSQTNKAQMVSDAFDSLDEAWQELEDAETPESIAHILIQFNEIKKERYPRWVRCSNIVSILNAIVEAIKADSTDKEGLEEFKSACENASSSLECVDFPSMFG